MTMSSSTYTIVIDDEDRDNVAHEHDPRVWTVNMTDPAAPDLDDEPRFYATVPEALRAMADNYEKWGTLR
jgi:hypothetical protein